MNRLSIAIAAILLVSMASDRAAALAERPTAALRRTNQHINALLRAKAKEGTPRAKRIESNLKEAINRFLDFQELARLALAKHWDKRTPAEQKEFVAVLRELIERNYIKQLKSRIDYRIDYRNEEISGNTATVNTSVRIKRDGRDEEILIEYRMKKANGAWMVFDVITDDVSIVRNYRSQFNRIIRRKSYRALVDKMKRKLGTI